MHNSRRVSPVILVIFILPLVLLASCTRGGKEDVALSIALEKSTLVTGAKYFKGKVWEGSLFVDEAKKHQYPAYPEGFKREVRDTINGDSVVVFSNPDGRAAVVSYVGNNVYNIRFYVAPYNVPFDVAPQNATAGLVVVNTKNRIIEEY